MLANIIHLLKLKNYLKENKKLEENVQAEIFQTVLDEAKEGYREEIVHELQSNTEQEREENCTRILSWIDQWHKDRGKVRSEKRKLT